MFMYTCTYMYMSKVKDYIISFLGIEAKCTFHKKTNKDTVSECIVCIYI